MMIQKCIRALSIVLVLVYASSFFSNRQNSLFISFSSLSSFLSSSLSSSSSSSSEKSLQ